MNKILGADFLKTIAIISVTLFHISPEKFFGTFSGVTMFFVISGYLIAYTSERARLAGKFSVLNFFLKRIKRIYPALLIVILTTVGVYSFLAPNVIEAIRPEIISVLLGYNNWWQIVQNADYFARLNNLTPFTHLWFLAVELQYFLLFPLILSVYAKMADAGYKKIALIFFAVISLEVAAIMPAMYILDAEDVTRLYYGTDTRIHALLFGTLLGLWHADRKNFSDSTGATKIFKQIIFVMCLAGFLISSVTFNGQSAYLYLGGMIFQATAVCLMLVFLADESLGIGKFFEKPVFTWLGKRSYGIFLWQYPVLFLFNYRGWNDSPEMLVAEIVLIILLTLWSDSVSESLISRKLPNFGGRLHLTRIALFFALSFVGMITMGFGFKGVAMSAETKADTAELQNLLETNKAIIEEQNQAAPVEKNISPQEIDLNGVVFIGDSITLASTNELRELFPNCYIDAAISRHIQGGLPAIQNFDAQGKLGKIVVVSLGTNGMIEEFGRFQQEMQEILNYLGKDRKIFLVNIYYTPQSPYQAWLNTNHDYIKQLEADNDNVFAVDWFSAISQQPEEIMSDGIHPREGGSKIYAKVIYDRIVEVLSNP